MSEEAATENGGEVSGSFDEVIAVDADSHVRFRARDSMGALPPEQAEVDAALARGYAKGLEEARADALDRFRTILMSILEAKFGELSSNALDRIEGANERTIEHWMIAALDAGCLDDVFSA